MCEYVNIPNVYYSKAESTNLRTTNQMKKIDKIDKDF